jgi:DedD protein
MRQVFGEPELDEAERSEETEITLGSIGLLIVCVSLLVICALCYGLGYSVGHHGPEPSMTVAQVQTQQQGADAPLAATPGKQKPQATPQPAAQTTTDSSAADLGSANDPDADVVGAGSSAAAQAGSAQPSTPGQPQWTVKPAMPQQSTQPTPVTVPGSSGIAPAGSAQGIPANAIMVQIAAVSHTEDAEVLMNALRRRGYAVTARRDLSDSLIHVQVGPFTNRNDANAMRVKLLNDGYNAVLEP